MIELWINGDQRTLPNAVSVAKLLESLNLPANRVAVEVDQVLVIRSEHEGYLLTGVRRWKSSLW